MSTKRKPYPGIESHRQGKDSKTRSYVPADGMSPHYSDSPSLSFYKSLLQALYTDGYKPHGHIDYDKKGKAIIIQSELGAKAAKEVCEREAIPADVRLVNLVEGFEEVEND